MESNNFWCVGKLYFCVCGPYYSTWFAINFDDGTFTVMIAAVACWEESTITEEALVSTLSVHKQALALAIAPSEFNCSGFYNTN